MRKRRKYSHNPMMYIAQPKLEQPSASMQSNYRTPKKKDKSVLKPIESKGDQKTKKLLPKSSPSEKQEQDIVYGDEETVFEELEESSSEDKDFVDKYDDSKLESSDASIQQRTKRKRFSEMSIEEKVDYFVGLPSQVPRMKCELRTEDERIRGVITDCIDNEVHVVSLRRPRHRKVSISEISDIRLISF